MYGQWISHKIHLMPLLIKELLILSLYIFMTIDSVGKGQILMRIKCWVKYIGCFPPMACILWLLLEVRKIGCNTWKKHSLIGELKCMSYPSRLSLLLLRSRIRLSLRETIILCTCAQKERKVNNQHSLKSQPNKKSDNSRLYTLPFISLIHNFLIHP